ncbi:MAG: hypothetical protein AAF567_25540 [Actinomycetota bacterium]
MTQNSINDLLARCPGYSINELLDLFPDNRDSHVSLKTAVERAELLLDIQDRVFHRFHDLPFDALHTVGFERQGHVYFASHFDWRGSLEAAAIVDSTARKVLGAGAAALNGGAAGAFGDLIRNNGGHLQTSPSKNYGNLLYAHNGYTFANVVDAFDVEESGDLNRTINLDNPSTLFFDTGGSLVGCGYIRPFRHTTHPHFFAPELAPLIDEWFVHVAGKHTDDGGFEAHHDHNHLFGDEGPRHHGDYWDLKIWFNVRTVGTETIHIGNVSLIVPVKEIAGIPLAGEGMGREHIFAPPNVGSAVSSTVIDQIPTGASIEGLYFPPDDVPH